jgi:RNA polymerase-binding transcription factor DksA
MVVGIDYGILCCDRCGALVPFDRRNAHDTFHVTVDSSAESCA